MRRIGLAALLLVAGCSGTTESGPPPSTPMPVPQDRNVVAVISALRHLDACALLEPGASAGGPHRCTSRGGNPMTVTLGVRFDREYRYRAALIDAGNAKAYLDASAPGTDTCRVALPVSFELTIAVDGRTGPGSASGDPCEPTRAAAAGVVRRLAAAATGNAANWTGCELLAAGLGRSTGLSNDGPTGLDECVLTEQDKRPYRINLNYGDDPAAAASQVRTVSGEQVKVLSDDTGCTYLWRAGSNPVVTFHAVDCAQGETLLPKLITTLTTANRERAAPQSPLLIRPDEPDQPLAGACVDSPYFTETCQPAAGVAVPKGAQQVLDAAGADGRVACALAAEAIRSGFGAALTPILSAPAGQQPHCYFVEPTHSVVVDVSARPGQGLDSGSDVTVAGRPGRSSGPREHRRLCVLPVSGAKSGVVCLSAQVRPGRGKEENSPADDTAADKLEPALATIVSRHFS